MKLHHNLLTLVFASLLACQSSSIASAETETFDRFRLNDVAIWDLSEDCFYVCLCSFEILSVAECESKLTS